MPDDDELAGFLDDLRKLANTSDKQFLTTNAGDLARRFKAVASTRDIEEAERRLANDVRGPQPIVSAVSGALEEQNRWLGAAQAALKVLRSK
jgi:hypothetical protein